MLNEEINAKWQPILEHPELDAIKDPHKRAVTALVLENTEKALREGSAWSTNTLLNETPANNIGDGATNVDTYDPVLISLVRRSMPNLMAYDICGVQPMTGPSGLIFAMKARFANTTNLLDTTQEALFNEADTDFSGTGTHANGLGDTSETTGTGVTTANMEANTAYEEMGFTIDKVTVTAKSRALKAEYTTELAQDLKAIHGLDAETELANILSAEILSEINREVIRTIFHTAKAGAQSDTASAGTFDLDVDSNGRWSVEKFKGLMFQIEREANEIAKQTRRGKGNVLICSSDVASALQMAGVLDYAPALANSLNVDDTGNTFAGVMNGRMKVYIDPYAGANYMIVGYKGSSAFDAGIFYCPYVPLQMVRAVGEDSFQPKIGFKTRYGMVANPFATSNGTGAIDNTSPASGDQNTYYRRVTVSNIM
tara:strand:+ start:274 stop:1554 length:1281 start_codon:yes stop_codon:yes gene_type:complete